MPPLAKGVGTCTELCCACETILVGSVTQGNVLTKVIVAPTHTQGMVADGAAIAQYAIHDL